MSTSCQVLDYKRLNASLDSYAESYRNAYPFPHIVIDDFLSAAHVSELNNKFPDPSIKRKMGVKHVPVNLEGGGEAQLGKEWLSRESLVDLAFRRLYWELNSGTFIHLLEEITGIKGLLADPHLLGGGVHRTKPGGYLKVHADFNKHPNFGLDRRLNLLIYLNENWLPEYGGNLELWPEDLQQCAQSIEPVAGRCVIFSTTSTSYHGHPQPLTCPPDRDRRSIALYYYSNGLPAGEVLAPHETLWQKLPGDR
ncbi:MAG: 2OG-Fe(II) oxygenase [Pseudomonadales bacterium]